MHGIKHCQTPHILNYIVSSTILFLKRNFLARMMQTPRLQIPPCDTAVCWSIDIESPQTCQMSFMSLCLSMTCSQKDAYVNCVDLTVGWYQWRIQVTLPPVHSSLNVNSKCVSGNEGLLGTSTSNSRSEIPISNLVQGVSIRKANTVLIHKKRFLDIILRSARKQAHF